MKLSPCEQFLGIQSQLEVFRGTFGSDLGSVTVFPVLCELASEARAGREELQSHPSHASGKVEQAPLPLPPPGRIYSPQLADY